MSPQTMSALIMLPSFHGISWSLSKQVLRNNNLITLQATHRDMAKPAKDSTHWDMSRAWGRENLTIYVLKIYCWEKKKNKKRCRPLLDLLLPTRNSWGFKLDYCYPCQYYLLGIFFGCLALPSGCNAQCRFEWIGWVAFLAPPRSCSSRLRSIQGQRSLCPSRNTFDLCIAFLTVNFGCNVIDNIFWKSLNESWRYQDTETGTRLVELQTLIGTCAGTSHPRLPITLSG